jgi:hypothetical protein
VATGAARLAGELTGATAPGNTPRVWLESGVVTAVVTGYAPEETDAIITVSWRGTTVPASYVSPYSPAEGDVVLLLIQPPGVIVLGRLIGPEGSS